MTREIPLSQGKVALVDDEDYGRVMAQGRWCAFTPNHNPSGRWYGVQWGSKNGKTTALLLHRFILGGDSAHIDHVNGDGLDNRRTNLRPASPSQNGANRGMTLNNTSGYKGVVFDQARSKWRAQIHVDGKNRTIGRYATPEDAAKAYDAAAIETWGEYARPNFPAAV